MSISAFYSPSLSRIFLQKNKKKLDSGGVEKLLVTCYVILSIILKTGFFGDNLHSFSSSPQPHSL